MNTEIKKRKEEEKILIRLISPKNKSIYFKSKEWYQQRLTLNSIATLTPIEFDVEVVDENKSEIVYDKKADIVAVIFDSSKYYHAYEIAYNYKKIGVPVVFSGFYPSHFPAEAQRHADSVVIGGAEHVWFELLSDFKKGNLKRFYSSVHSNISDVKSEQLIEEQIMNSEIRKDKKRDGKMGVFMTGATGFVGSNLVCHLLLEDKYKLFCLVRPHKGDPKKRLIETVLRSAETAGLSSEDISKKLDNLTAISGDLTEPSLGISNSEMQLLRDFGIDHVWHAGAFIKHDAFFRKEVFKNNVEGTRNVVALAILLQVSEFNHISTVYVAGKRSGSIDGGFYDSTYDAANCYEESKREAEDIVLSASKHGHFHLRVFRPSTVIGNAKTYKATSNSEFYAFLSALEKYIEFITDRISDHYENNPFVIYAEEGATLNLIPVDILINEALSISKVKKTSPEIYNLTNPSSVSGDLFIRALKNSFPAINFKLTNNIEELSAVDKPFRKKVELSNTTIITNKQFASHIDNKILSKILNFTKSDLVKHIDNFIANYRESRKKRKDEINKLLDTVEKNKIICRYGKELNYFKIGNGPVIVLFNAYGHKHEALNYLTNNLSKNYTVIHWDYRGLKDSDLPNDHFIWGAEEHVEDLMEILKNEGIEKCHLIACCAGSVPCMKFYKKYSSFVKSFIHINGLFFTTNTMEFLEASEQSGQIKYMDETLCNEPERASEFVEIFKALKNDEFPVFSLDEMITKVPSQYSDIVFGNYLNEEYLINFAKQEVDLTRHDADEILDNVKVPTFLIAGQLDVILSPSISEVTAKKIPDARFYSMPAAGHNVFIENDEECADVLKYFLKSVS